MGTKKDVEPIGLLPQNLRSEEMIVQLFDRLNRIQSTSHQLFESINQRIIIIRKSVEEVQKRTADASQKIVSHLNQEGDKAIKVFSPPRYPIEEKDHLDYRPIYPKYMFYQLSSRRNNVTNTSKYKIESQHIPFDDELISYKLEHIQSPLSDIGLSGDPLDTDHGYSYSLMERKLIDDILPRITSVTSLLTFHHYENVLLKQFGRAGPFAANSSLYDQGRYHRPKKTVSPSVNEHGDTGENLINQLGPAPESINNYEDFMVTSNTSDLLAQFMPDHVDDESMLNDDLPDMLPFLTGIVRDISEPFDVSSNMRTLTKSMSNTSMSERPYESSDPRLETKTSTAIPTETSPPKLPASAPSSPPPPPPPPPLPPIEYLLGTMKLSTIPENRSGETSNQQLVDSAISLNIGCTRPIPPIPPPLPTAPEMKAKVPEITNQVAKSIPSADGGRASLLESIRAAAGKPKKVPTNLRDKKIEAKKERQQKEEAVGGDLISDLVNKLKMRRDGISGSLNANQQSKAPRAAPISLSDQSVIKSVQQRTLEKVSSLIPPPPQTQPNLSSSDESDVSNDDNWT